jgi:hypothetical protein
MNASAEIRENTEATTVIRELTAEEVEHVSGGQGVIIMSPAVVRAALYPH